MTGYEAISDRGFRCWKGKKNGKSLVASAVGLYMQIADGEMGPEVVSAATTRDQAKKDMGSR